MKSKYPRTKFYNLQDAYKEYEKEARRYSTPNTQIIDYKTYKSIVVTFIKIINEFILGGIIVCLPRLTGMFGLIYFKRKLSKSTGYLNLVPNWGESNKLKKQILERGGTLYEEWYERDGRKFDIPLQGSVKKNNGGEKWMVYYVDEGYYKFSWGKTSPFLYKEKRFKLWHLTGYNFKPVKDLKKRIKEVKDSPNYKYTFDENDFSEVNLERCIQKFRDTGRKLDKRCN